MPIKHTLERIFGGLKECAMTFEAKFCENADGKIFGDLEVTFFDKDAVLALLKYRNVLFSREP